MSRLVTCVLIAVVMGSICWGIPAADQMAVWTRFALQFMALVFMGVVFANTVQGVVATERPVFYRERAARAYRPFVLNLVAGLCELPYVFANTFVFTCLFYWMVGMAADMGLFLFWYGGCRGGWGEGGGRAGP